MRMSTHLSLAAIGLLSALYTGALHASDEATLTTTVVTAKATDAACVDVEVDGVRAPSYNCLSQKLQPKPTPKPASATQMGSESIIQRPSNELGLFNRAASGHRMGNTFGTSVYPQRPPDRP
ncbi:hypothetical protein D3C72_86960 [compost metagenome]